MTIESPATTTGRRLNACTRDTAAARDAEALPLALPLALALVLAALVADVAADTPDGVELEPEQVFSEAMEREAETHCRRKRRTAT